MRTFVKRSTYIFVLAFMFCIFLVTARQVLAATMEAEPNDTKQTAQLVTLDTEYSGAVADKDNTDDEDYYRIPVTEGSFYLISVYNMKDIGDYAWETMIVDLCKDTDTNSSYNVVCGEYTDTTKLFQAAYTGDYYLSFGNSSNTQYSFMIEEFNPVGYKVKDSDSNVYKITSNSKLELLEIAGKKKSDFYFRSSLNFSTIGDYDLLDYYDVDFKVTSIGAYAFKGSAIKSISIPPTVKKIGTGAFQNCKKLGTEEYVMGLVIRGKNVTIGSKAFYGCKKLGTIRVVKGASIKSVKKGAFKGTKKGISIEVPNVKKYKKIFKNAGFSKPKFEKTYV